LEVERMRVPQADSSKAGVIIAVRTLTASARFEMLSRK
jgi:hypothetical protein